MATPTIIIHIDPGPWEDPQWRNHRPTGGKVAGRVRVSCMETLACRGVRLTIGWRTEGRGDQDSALILDDTPHYGELSPGDHEFPFSVEIPAGPISYQGHHIKIVWFAAARIDLAWKRDPKAEQQFLVTLP
ncbi:MAG: hypothetical protein MPJ50_13430 [Pirellulales bacterium]|nr:hypothetical protein [Pirellulales bacterium]